MQKQIDVIFFSPTGTTRKIALSAAQGFEYKINTIDLTKEETRNKEYILKSDAVIIAVPVYEERIPTLLHHFFNRLRAQGQPAAIIAVYGNIGHGVALNQLYEQTSKSSLLCLAAAAFIGEHSFSTANYPVAADRPNKYDLKSAHSFGVQVRNKIDSGNQKFIQIPIGKTPWFAHLMPKDGAKIFSKQPIVDLSLCTKCNLCVYACPVNAIDKETFSIDEAKCLRCFACAKKCPVQARTITFKSPIIASIFKLKGSKNHENELFLT